MNVTLNGRRLACLALALVLGIGLAAATHAQTVLVDFGSNSSFRGVSVPAPDMNGHYWNSLTPGPFYADLVDINNAATTVDLGYDTPVGTDSYNGPAGPTSIPPTAGELAATDIDAAALGNLGVTQAAFDFAASPGGLNNNTRFQIQGLDPNKKYTLTLFGSHKFSDDSTTVYTVFNSGTYTTAIGTANLQIQDPMSPWLHNRDKVATIGGLSPDASGILYVQFVGNTGNQGYLNSFQLTGVPEPASFALVSLALVAAAGIRRR